MSNSPNPYRLLAPGPVPVPPQILARMNEKVLHHRTPAFEKILKETWSGLKTVFATGSSVHILAGTGSAAMEAAVLNLLSPGDQALVVVSGKFGERWADMCERYGVKTHRLNVPWGEAVDLSAFEDLLKSHRAVKVVMTQVCETSTATVHPVQKMAQIVAKHSEALFAVDAITAVGCMRLPMDEWNIDVMVAGSQKAFMIPAGLSFIALSEKAWRAQAQSRLPKYYFDLAAEKKANDRGETFFSTPTSLVAGLHGVVQKIEKEGLNKVMARCHSLAKATRLAGEKLGLKVYSKAPSDSVTALKVADGQNSGQIRDWLEKEKNITIMGGQDQLKGKILRIGHMGHIVNEDMHALFQALGEGLKNLEAVKAAQTVLEAELKNAEPLF